MTKIADELRRTANEVFPFAQAVSNTGKPESDNNVGRATVTMKLAADEIKRLERLAAAQKEYISLLTKAMGRTASFLNVHGVFGDAEDIAEGARLRNKILIEEK